MEFEIDKVVTAETDTERCIDLHVVPVEDMEALLHDRIVSEYRGEAWKDMRHQWGVNDAKRDGNKTLSDDVEIYEIISENDLYEITGIQKQKFNTIYQLMALKQQNPESLDRAQSMLMIPDYFNFLLTGNKLQEYTNATTTQLVDPKANDWNWALIDRLGYDPELVREALSETWRILFRNR